MRWRSSRFVWGIGAAAIVALTAALVDVGTVVGVGDVTMGHAGDLCVFTAAHA